MTDTQLDNYLELSASDPDWASFLIECARLAHQSKSVILRDLLSNMSDGLNEKNWPDSLVPLPLSVEIRDTQGDLIEEGEEKLYTNLPNGDVLIAFGVSNPDVLANIAVGKKVLVHVTLPKEGRGTTVKLVSARR